MESEKEITPAGHPAPDGLVMACQEQVVRLDLQIIGLLSRRCRAEAEVRRNRARCGIPCGELARENRFIRMYTDAFGRRGAQFAGALLGMAADTVPDDAAEFPEREVGLPDLVADRELWPLVRRMVTSAGMTRTLADWLGYAPRMELLHQSAGAVPESLWGVVHSRPGEHAQERSIRFLDRDGEVLLSARAVAMLGRLPVGVRSLLTQTSTPLGLALAEMRPKRHLLHWAAVAGADGRPELLRVTARLDSAGVPVAWVSECLRLRELGRARDASPSAGRPAAQGA